MKKLFPFRKPIVGCPQPRAYKYFFDPSTIDAVWVHLTKEYGPIKYSLGQAIKEILTDKFIFRSMHTGNPITVYFTIRCSPSDEKDFHRKIDFLETQDKGEI